MSQAGLEISDSQSCRRYFAKFTEITRHFHHLAAELSRERRADSITDHEIAAVENYLMGLSNSFTALSIKYLLTGLVSNKLPSRLAIDQQDSGFPLFQEVIQMATDHANAARHLEGLAERETIKADIVDHVLEQRSLPRDLQFAMSQRVYYEMLASVPLFFAQNHPQLVPIGHEGGETRTYFVHWAVYDTQRNLPNLYLMVLEDTGERPLTRSERRWPKASEHLMAQSLSSLKLLTIARGFDQDFDTLHPVSLKRVHLGPMYSNRFTRHADVVQTLLAESDSEPGQDWVFCWTVETLRSKGSEKKAIGLFGSVRSEIYDIDPQAPEQLEAGVTQMERSMILPYRPYQRLVESDPVQLRGLRKFVVGPDGLVMKQA